MKIARSTGVVYRKVKSNVARNKVAYAASMIAVAAVMLQQSNNKAFYSFLTEKGIDPEEYYSPESYAEKTAS